LQFKHIDLALDIAEELPIDEDFIDQYGDSTVSLIEELIGLH